MSNEIRNDIICNSNIDIMEYLILKLESRQKNLSKYGMWVFFQKSFVNLAKKHLNNCRVEHCKYVRYCGKIKM